jgi:excisionase family DNA binding protein
MSDTTHIEQALLSESGLGRSVSIEQAGRLLSVSRRTVYTRIREGRLQTVRTLGGSQRVLVESLYNDGFRPQAFSTSPSAATSSVRPPRTYSTSG